MSVISLEQQLACAKRELALRQRVYPRFITQNRMTATQAAHELAAMTAIVTTINHLLHEREHVDASS